MTRTWTFLSVLAIACATLMPGCGDDAISGPYDQCADDFDCTSAVDGCAFVSRTITVGICTNNCATDLDCPLDVRGIEGACLSVEGTPFICYERCVDDFDCPPDLVCTGTMGVSNPICLPP